MRDIGHYDGVAEPEQAEPRPTNSQFPINAATPRVWRWGAAFSALFFVVWATSLSFSLFTRRQTLADDFKVLNGLIDLHRSLRSLQKLAHNGTSEQSRLQQISSESSRKLDDLVMLHPERGSVRESLMKVRSAFRRADEAHSRLAASRSGADDSSAFGFEQESNRAIAQVEDAFLVIWHHLTDTLSGLNRTWRRMHLLAAFSCLMAIMMAFVVSLYQRIFAERQQVEVALRNAQERYWELFENANDIVFTIDLAGNFTSLNKMGEQVFGYSRRERVNFSQILEPEQYQAAREMFQQKLSKGGQTRYELIVRAKDGRRVPMEVSTRLIYEDGKPVGVQGIARDVTEAKRAQHAAWESEERFRSLFEEAPVAYHEIDKEGIVRRVNQAECTLLGFEASAMVGRPIWEFVATEERQKSRDAVLRKLSGTQRLMPFHRTYARKDGTRVLLEIHESFIRDDAGVIVGIRTAMLDVTERKRTEEALRESQERYTLAMDGANDGLWDWNLKTAKVYYSARWKAMLGYGEAEIGDSPEEWFSRAHPEDLNRLKLEVDLHLEGKKPHFEVEHRMRRRDGSYGWVLCRGLAVQDATGRPVRMAGSQADVTERKLMEQRLLHDALYDSLTGLPNRALFMERLESATLRARRNPESLFAVLFLDFDRFKVINDSLGHSVGDQLLIAIARRLESCVRADETVCRLGGDEFAVLTNDIKMPKDAEKLADRIQREIQQPFSLGEHEVFTSVSVGIALSSPRYRQSEELLRDADTAMYRAKGLGKARHEIYRRGMHTRAMERLQLDHDLRRALERQEFAVYYQPIVGLAGGDITAVEALVRWQHPATPSLRG